MKRKLWHRPHYTGTGYQMFFRKLSAPISALLLKTPITPNQVTVAAILVTPLIGLALASSALWANCVGVLLLYVAHILDRVDGQIARARNLASRRGQFLDGIFTSCFHVSLFLPIGIRFYREGQDWLLFVALATTIVMLINNFNNINRAYLLSSNTNRESSRLGLPKHSPTKARILQLGTMPAQHYPEILLIAILTHTLPILLVAYLIYHTGVAVLTAVMLSRFPDAPKTNTRTGRA